MSQSQSYDAMKQELERYRLIFQHAPLGIFHLNAQGMVTDCNEKLTEIMGGSKESIIGVNVLELRDEAYMEAARKALKGQSSVYEGTYQSVIGGKESHVRVLFAPVICQEEASCDVVAMVEDITLRKEAEDQLRQSQQRLQVALENSEDGVWEWHVPTGETQVTERWLDLLGYSSNELDLSVSNFPNFVHPDDRENTQKILEDFALGREEKLTDLFRMRCKDGSYKWFYTIGKMVEWSGKGDPVRAIGTHRDVTQQQKAVEALKESERSKAVLLSNLPGMAYRCEYRDGLWEMTYISEGCLALTGYSPERFVKKATALKDIVLPEGVIPGEYREPLWDKWLQMMREKQMFRSEYPIIQADGTLKWVWEQGRILTDELGRVEALECFITDITERREAEEQKRQLDQLKDEFLANTSHELRTPLTGIISLVESLISGVAGSLSQEQIRNLNLVRLSARRLASLVNDILDFSRMRHHDIRLNLKPVDIHGVLEVVLELLRYQVKDGAVSLINHISADCPPLLADENRVTQILFNLVGNALNYTEKGSVIINACEEEGMMVVSVADTGIGIPEDRLDTIFDYFQQGGLSPDHESRGTGLGLPITRQLVELHGGIIRAASTPGEGTTISFSLPIARQAALNDQQADEKKRFGEESVDDKTPNSGDARWMERIEEDIPVWSVPGAGHSEFTVMVVDDEPVNVQSLANALSLKNIGVTWAFSGKEALEKLEKGPIPDLCIVDIMMPKMNGFQLCEHIRRRFTGFQLPVVFLTARYGEQELQKGFQAGGNDFLHKPFETAELMARVETLLNLKKSVSSAMAAEIAFLQAQIKPHFLYNALNTIAAYCETEGEKAGRLILSLSRFLRGSFSFDNLQDRLPLEKELELTKAYVEIEKARFPALDVMYQLKADPGLMLPPLVIQPLVENAIRHGICGRKEGGTVLVKVETGSDGTWVEIRDDGVGAEPALFQEILDQTMCGKGVGLCNIEMRLQRFYGEGLKVESRPGEGTRVWFRIPGKEGKDAESSRRG